jgi:hypothetical protein
VQLKNKRDFTLVEVLENTLALVPIEQRLGLAIKFSTCEKMLGKNLETIYLLATQRLLHLSYYLEWSRTIESTEQLRPKPLDSKEIDYIPLLICEFDKMPSDQLNFMNASFVEWINNQVVRELNEFFKLYLSELHEICTALEYAKTPIRPIDIVDIRKQCNDFESGGLQERLGILRKKFGFILTKHDEILSLYKLRNIFSHYDGVVMKKFCKDGYLEIRWPQNTYKFKKRGRNEWDSYQKARKSFRSDIYESVQIKWLSKPEIRKYKPLDQIKLSHKDLNNLIFFYLCVFNELHKKLVDIVKEQGFRVKPFEKYMTTIGGVTFVSANKD